MKPVIPPSYEQELADLKRALRHLQNTRPATTGTADADDTLRVQIGLQADDSYDVIVYDAGGVEVARLTELSADLAAETAARIAADSALDVRLDAIEANDWVTNARMADDAVGIAELSATGTPDASTFLRGDNTWAAPGGGGAAIARDSVNQVISVAAAATATDEITMAKTFQLHSITADKACRVRLYASAALRTADAARPVGTPPDVSSGVIEVILTAGLLTAIMDAPPSLMNIEGTPTADVPISVTNDGAGSDVDLTFVFLPLEA